MGKLIHNPQYIYAHPPTKTQFTTNKMDPVIFFRYLVSVADPDQAVRPDPDSYTR